MSGVACMGASVARVVTAADFSDSLNDVVVEMNGFSTVRPNACSALRLSLTAGCSELKLFVNCNLVGGYDSTVGVTIDGTYSGVACTQAVGLYCLTATIDPSTAHVVEITQGWLVGGTDGHFLYAVSAIGGSMAVLPNPSVARRLVVYGDSIAIGGCAEPMSQKGWLQLLRADYPGRIAMEGSGGWSLRADTQPAYSGRGVDAIAASIAGLCFDATTCDIWDEIGYNDWLIASAGWEPAVYTETLGELYDAIHALKPGSTIYCQTQITSGDETATNALGHTIEVYRAAKAAAATGRAWVQVVDGTAFVEAGDLVDGIHPGTAGHAKMATAIAGVLGI